jgi:hypothetical protein
MDAPQTEDSLDAATAWTSPRSYVTVLVALFLDEFGTDGLKWHPATIKLEVEDTFGITLPGPSFDRLMCGIWLLTSDRFYKSAPDFVWACNVLSFSPFEPTEFEPADTMECAWGISEALLLAPPDDRDEEPFSDEIRRYLGAVLRREGIADPPDVLAIAIPAGMADPAGNYADAPELAGGIREVAGMRASEINTTVRNNLRELLRQLGSLDLREGDARGLLERLSPEKRGPAA